MEKIKIPASERFKTILISLLTLSMLLLAGIYISGAQLAGGTAALGTKDLPDGAVALGQAATALSPLHEKNLLPVSFAAIRYGGEGGGTYGTEQAADTLFAFAADPIHALLSKEATLEKSSIGEYERALQGNYICIHLYGALPYQILYALTGEATAAAGSDTAINASRLLLSLADNGDASLYLADGEAVYAARGAVSLKSTELAALANDSRLSDCSILANGIALSAGSPHAAELSLAATTPDPGQYPAILSLLGYNPEAGIAGADEALWVQAVAPHGTLQISGTAMTYTAAKDSGIPISDFLDTPKSELDIDMYDFLAASVALAEQLRATAPDAFGGEGSLCVREFYRTEDGFAVELGLYTDSIILSGDAYPYFARLTARGGKWIAADIRFLHLTKNAYTGMLFPSDWQYQHAAKSAELSSLRLTYRVQRLPDTSVIATWLYTGTAKEAEVTE